MRWLLATVVAFGLTAPAAAEVAGQADPAFVAAQTLWLSGDEAGGLGALSGLAKGGNRAARLLLGQIDATPALQGAWLGGLTREARIALLRSPGGVSGRVWMRALAAEDPVAEVWSRLWQGDASMAVILDFARLGEPRLARFAAMTLARRQQHGFAQAATDPDYPAAVLAFAIREDRLSNPARAATAAAALHPGDPQREILGEAADPATVAAWIAAAAEGDPVVALCETVCAEVSASSCHAASYAALGGYWRLMAMGSPVETLIASTEFNRSAKGIEVILRQMALPPGAPQCLQAASGK